MSDAVPLTIIEKLSKSLSRILVPTLLVIVSTVVTLVAMEYVTRYFCPAFDPSGRFALGYNVGILSLGKPGAVERLTKNTGEYDVAIRINKYGLRDDRSIADARPDDIVVVGDSFSWGYGVETSDRFSNRLEPLTGHRVFNLATLKSDFAGYAALLEYGKSFGAQFGQIVLTVCMENDLRDYSLPDPALDNTNRPQNWIGSIKLWLLSNSAIYFMATTAIQEQPWLRDIATKTGLIVPNADAEGMLKTIYDEKIIESSAETLSALAHQYHMLVVLIPSRGLWIPPYNTIEDKVHNAFAASLRTKGVRVLDLRAALEAGGKPLSYHFPYDGHWNASGHALAASVIANCLKNEACH